MARLGISIYVGHSDIQKDLEYMRKAAKAGFSRIFMDLLAAEDKTKEMIIEEFLPITELAQSLNMEIVLDISPQVLTDLNLDFNDLSFFQSMNVSGIRLDEGFDGIKERDMSFNKENLKIELNASQLNGLIDKVMVNYPNKNNIITCHNFYPQRYTGLSLEHFNLCNENIAPYNLKIAAFVSSQNEDTFGPWPVNEGLCTLEMHRDLPIDTQIRHLMADGKVDDIIIGNAYASDEELETCAKITPGILAFKLEPEKTITENELKVLYEHDHHVRGDMSEYMARSTMPRITYAALSIKPENTRDLKRGDVIIVNEEYKRYKGELHIVLKDMPNDGRKNVLGRIPENEMFMLDYIKPWRPFEFLK